MNIYSHNSVYNAACEFILDVFVILQRKRLICNKRIRGTLTFFYQGITNLELIRAKYSPY